MIFSKAWGPPVDDAINIKSTGAKRLAGGTLTDLP